MGEWTALLRAAADGELCGGAGDVSDTHLATLTTRLYSPQVSNGEAIRRGSGLLRGARPALAFLSQCISSGFFFFFFLFERERRASDEETY